MSKTIKVDAKKYLKLKENEWDLEKEIKLKLSKRIEDNKNVIPILGMFIQLLDVQIVNTINNFFQTTNETKEEVKAKIKILQTIIDIVIALIPIEYKELLNEFRRSIE